MGSPILGWEDIAGGDFGEDEEGDEPAPDKEAELDVVPERHECEDDQHIPYSSRGGPVARRTAAAAQRHVDVADGPAVEATVPAAPEG